MKYTSFPLILVNYLSLIFVPNIICIRVNQSKAVRLCKDKGGLVASFLFPRVIVTLANVGEPRGSVLYSQLKNVEMEDGESAWVAGYARYGEFWNHWGCYLYDDENTFAASDKQQHRGFYQCSKYCENLASSTSLYGLFFIAINKTSCFCLRKIYAMKKHACPHNNENQLLLELYRKRNRSPTQGHYQCASITANAQNVTGDITSKCFERKHIVCFFFIKPVMCNDVILKDNLYCDVGYSTTWMNGAKVCNSLSGILVPYLTREFMITMRMDSRYWTGAVSAYTIQTEPGDACLAVTRLRDELVLEPDDCAAERSFICATDITQGNNNGIPYSYTSKMITKQTPSNAILTIPKSTTNTININVTVTGHSSSSADDSEAFSQNITSIIHTPGTSALPASIIPGHSSSVDINIVLVVIASCSVIVALAVTCMYILHKTNSNTERRTQNITQHNIIMADNRVEDEENHEYATINENDLVDTEFKDNLESTCNYVSNSDYLTVVDQNEAMNVDCSNVFSENTTSNINKETCDLEQNKITNQSCNARYRDTVHQIRKHTNFDLSCNCNDDVCWYEQLAHKKEEPDTNVYESTVLGTEERGASEACADEPTTLVSGRMI